MATSCSCRCSCFCSQLIKLQIDVNTPAIMEPFAAKRLGMAMDPSAPAAKKLRLDTAKPHVQPRDAEAREATQDELFVARTKKQVQNKLDSLVQTACHERSLELYV